jgi:hypothetical protein
MALITALLKDMIDAVIIFTVVLINATIGYIQGPKQSKQFKLWRIR